MKAIITVSHVESRKQIADIMRKVADDIESDRADYVEGHLCVSGHLGTQGDYTYDIIEGDDDYVVATKFFTV